MTVLLRNFALEELISGTGWRFSDICGIQSISMESRVLDFRGETWDELGQGKDMGSHEWVKFRDTTKSAAGLAPTKVLLALSGMRLDAQRLVTGQYAGYQEDINRPNSKTETFVARKAIVAIGGRLLDLYFFTGKGMARKENRLVLMRKVAGTEEMEYLVIEIDPFDCRGIYEVTTKAGEEPRFVNVGSKVVHDHLEGPFGNFSAYARLLYSVLHGHTDVGLGEIEAVMLQRIMAEMYEKRMAIRESLQTYERGSTGPSLAHTPGFILPENAQWLLDPIPDECR
jgi:glucose-6-phosphate 1-dehydrogenase